MREVNVKIDYGGAFEVRTVVWRMVARSQSHQRTFTGRRTALYGPRSTCPGT